MRSNTICCWMFCVAVSASLYAQLPSTASADLTKIAADGFIDAGKYENPTLRLAIDMPDAQATVASVAKGEKLVRLVQIMSAPSVREKFGFTVLADGLSSYPDLKSPEPYVRSVVVSLLTFADNLRFTYVQREIVLERLHSCPAKDIDRERQLQTYFAQAGCR